MSFITVASITLLFAGVACGQTSIKGSGSSAAAPYITAAAANATTAAKAAGQTITIAYNTSSSTAGRTDVTSKVTDFAVSDVPFAASAYNSAYAQIPVALGLFSVATSYAGLSSFNLDAATLAGIYTCKLTTWDQVSSAVGNGLKATGPITPCARNDSSGTTQVFTQYLATAGSAWTLGVNQTIAWPSCVKTASGTGALATLIKSTPNAIGYVEYGTARNQSLASASLKNAAGSFVSPSSANFANLAITVPATVTSPDWANLNFATAPLATSYPITGIEYVIVPANLANIPSTGNAAALLKQFISYLLSDQAQASTTVAGFGPLPSTIRSVAIRGVNALTGISGNTNFGLPQATAPAPTSGSAGRKFL